MLHQKLKESNYHVIYPLFLLLFLLVGTFFAFTQAQQNQNSSSRAAVVTSNCTVSASQLTARLREQTLFDKVNAYRVQNGLTKLIWDATLKQAAAWQSADMRAHGTLSHTDSLGRPTAIRLNNCGYPRSNAYGENLTLKSLNQDEAFNYWKASPEHNQIMLVPGYNIGAVAMEADSTGQNAYYTMEFGVNDSLTVTPVPNTPSLSVTPTSTNIVAPNPTITNSQTETPTPNLTDAALSPVEPTPTPAKVAVDMKIAVKVKISGIGKGGNSSPRHLTRRVQAIIFGTAKEPVTTGTGFLTYDNNNYFTGIIHLGKLGEGSYFVNLVSDGTLQVLAQPEFQTLLGDRINDIPPVTLYQGDMNNDNVLNIDDYNIALPCFQNKRCDTANVIDFNDDGKTDVTDYNLLLQSFEQLHGN